MNNKDSQTRRSITIDDLFESAEGFEEEGVSAPRKLIFVGESREISDLFQQRGFEIVHIDKIPKIFQREYYEELCIQRGKEAYAKAMALNIKDIVAIPYPFKTKGKPVSPVKSQKKPRNAKCICGSGKKNKNCCNF